MTSKTIAMLILTGLTACTRLKPPEEKKGQSESEEFVECVRRGPTPIQRHCDSAQAREKFDPQKTIDAARVAEKLAPPPKALKFTAIGPRPLKYGKLLGNLEVSGRANAIAVHPTDHTHWLIGTAAGGIFETKNGGNRFDPITDIEGLPVFAIGAIAFAKDDPDTIYAGLGEAYETSTSYTGHGIIRSDDAGKTWDLLGGDTFAGSGVTHILVDPKNKARIFVANSIHTAQADDPESTRSTDPKNRGIYFSEDGGFNFKQIEIPLIRPKDFDVTSFAAHPSDFNKMVALGTQSSAGGGERAFLVRRTDAGKSWNVIFGPWAIKTMRNGHSQIAISPSQPGVAYVSIGGDEYVGMWRTDNLWAFSPKWDPIEDKKEKLTEAGRDSFCKSQCWYNHTLSVDPSNPDILYVGGISLFKYNHDDQSWTDVGLSETRKRTHEDQHDLEWAGKSLIVANDGGVWSTKDGGSTFEPHNKTLPTIQFWHGAITKDGMLVAGGAQDNGTSIYLLSASKSTNLIWAQRDGGDGFSTAFNDAGDKMITSFQYGKLFRFPSDLDRKKESQNLISPGKTSRKAPFQTLFAQCPHNENHLVLNGLGEVKHTTSAFKKDVFWINRIYDPSTSPSPISTIAYSPNATESGAKCAIFAFADRAGQIFSTRNFGGSFLNLDPPERNRVHGKVPDLNVTDIIFTAKDKNSNTMYITVAGYGQGHVYRSKCEPKKARNGVCAEGEATGWTNISSAIDTPHHTVVYVEGNDWLFVGTDVGVLLLEEASQCADSTGCKWRHFGLDQGLPYVAVQDMQIDEAEKILVAFTHGRSAYKLEIN